MVMNLFIATLIRRAGLVKWRKQRRAGERSRSVAFGTLTDKGLKLPKPTGCEASFASRGSWLERRLTNGQKPADQRAPQPPRPAALKVSRAEIRG
jgi:hypothetical protein